MKQNAIDKAFKKAFKGQSCVDGDDSFRGKHWQWPSLDPGAWRTDSLLIIYHESGLPDSGTHPQSFPLWERFEKELSEAMGLEVYRQNINGGVSAIYAA